MPCIRRWVPRLLVLLSLAFVVALRPGAAVSAVPADTERGLDVWAHMPAEATSGGVLPINLLALGFPTASTTRPIAGATVEATWDPESLVEPGASPSKKIKKPQPSPKPAVAPPTVGATTDGAGRATLELAVPEGSERSIKLLLSVSANGKQRVREIDVQRRASTNLRLFVSDTRVVPGSEVIAWLLLGGEDGAKPTPNMPVEVRLLQGGLVRFRRDVTTDVAGSATLRVPIPRDEARDVSWTLDARTKPPGGALVVGSHASVSLSPREETPGKPTFWASFDDEAVGAGAAAKARVRLRDGSDEGVAGHAVWIWSGPRGTEPPSDMKDFQRVAKRHVTDGAGEVVTDVVAPSTIPLRGSQLSLAARSELEGQPLSASATIDVARKLGSVTITPEAGDLVPGLEQRVYLRVLDDRGEPAKTRLIAKADGLDAEVTTNEQGDGELVWKVPVGIGAKRDTGPCPGTVAAALSLTAAPGEKPLELASITAPLCVGVDRAAKVILRAERSIVTAGDKLPVEVIGADKSPISVVLAKPGGASAVATWNPGDARRVELTVPESFMGVAHLAAALPQRGRAARVAQSAVLVLPRTLPKLTATLAGGRAAPGGRVVIEGVLADNGGKPLQGSVVAVVIDKFGGGSFGPIRTMDTRATLCSGLGAETKRCDQSLSVEGGAEIYRRSLLRGGAAAGGPVLDPDSRIKEEVDVVFKDVIQSLEGAVYQASAALETLPDVRRTTNGKHTFNPELMTLVTEAMDPPPEMPGGEPVALADLVAIDPQITFDTVARRVTRLKLFEVLRAVRQHRVDERLDPDEPILAEPNVLLKKLLREGGLSDANVIDPWGGRIAFTKAGGEVVPFITVSRGWELRSPGPDGKMGTGDDVKSPFERVLKSGTPYANAVDEDRLVEARFDMRVADATVDAWDTTLRESTGTALGRGQGIGLGGVGLVGHGAGGGGSGMGRGMGRITTGAAKGVLFVSKAVRTDEQGRVRVEVPLGDVETTWRVALVGIPDKARTAVAHVDVPVTIPLSAKVFAGTVWTDGDRAEAAVTVRNRTDRDLDVTLAIDAKGAFAVDAKSRASKVRVGKLGAATVYVPVTASGSGRGVLQIKTSAAGVPEDALTHDVDVLPKGEVSRVARAAWVDRETDFGPHLTRAGLQARGPASVVLERGTSAVLEGALDALAAESVTSLPALTESTVAAGLIVAFERRRGSEGSRLGARAKESGRAAAAKLLSIDTDEDLRTLALGRVIESGVVTPDEVRDTPECPPTWELLTPSRAHALLEAEPAAEGGAAKDCWTAAVAKAKNVVEAAESPAAVARATLALASKPHRSVEAKRLASRLVSRVAPTDTGVVNLPAGATRADRALVYAALIEAGGFEGARKSALLSWLLVQRDAGGGFGSAAATRAAVHALVGVASTMERGADTTVLVDFGDAGQKRVTVGADARVVVAVPDKATRAAVVPSGGAVLARLERDFLRPYDVAPVPSASGLSLTVEWPEAPRPGRLGNLEVNVRGGAGQVEVKIPLPPGATLADAAPGVRQVQGKLYWRTTLSETSTVTIPVRFVLAGQTIAREATVTPLDRDELPAVERARPVAVHR